MFGISQRVLQKKNAHRNPFDSNGHLKFYIVSLTISKTIALLIYNKLSILSNSVFHNPFI